LLYFTMHFPLQFAKIQSKANKNTTVLYYQKLLR
jgi:hypothetical protein